MLAPLFRALREGAEAFNAGSPYVDVADVWAEVKEDDEIMLWVAEAPNRKKSNAKLAAMEREMAEMRIEMATVRKQFASQPPAPHGQQGQPRLPPKDPKINPAPELVGLTGKARQEARWKLQQAKNAARVSQGASEDKPPAEGEQATQRRGLGRGGGAPPAAAPAGSSP